MKSAKTILVVEDDFELRRVLCTALEQAGFRTVASADGAEALRRLRSGEKADMILTNLRMPNMDGFGFREELAKDAGLAAIPVIVITGVIGEAITKGAAAVLDVITKPFDLNALVQRIKSHFPAENGNGGM
jgi:two-component system chemotaxis response regulator CheY